MKRNKLLIVITCVFYLVFVFLIGFYVIRPGIVKIVDANEIKDLSYDEKTLLIDEINVHYAELEKGANDKYEPLIDEVNLNYNNKVVEINSKYDALEKKLNDEYKEKEKVLKNKKNDLDVLQNKEFFANAFSKRWYTLGDQIDEVREQISDLDDELRDSIKENNDLKNGEINLALEEKKSELLNIQNNKSQELERLNDKKILEKEEIDNREINKSNIMTSGIFMLVIGIIIVLIPVLYCVLVFNKLTHLLNSVKESWSQVDVFLKQRSDLIPNIVESVKGFSKHEKKTFESIISARNNVIKASSKEEEIVANKELGNVLTNIFLLTESYPELKANVNFMNLQDNLKEIEDNISVSRQIYNKNVLKYKNKMEMFPSNIVAKIFMFKMEMFFEIEEDDKTNPNVEFK